MSHSTQGLRQYRVIVYHPRAVDPMKLQQLAGLIVYCENPDQGFLIKNLKLSLGHRISHAEARAKANQILGHGEADVYWCHQELAELFGQRLFAAGLLASLKPLTEDT